MFQVSFFLFGHYHKFVGFVHVCPFSLPLTNFFFFVFVLVCFWTFWFFVLFLEFLLFLVFLFVVLFECISFLKILFDLIILFLPLLYFLLLHTFLSFQKTEFFWIVSGFFFLRGRESVCSFSNSTFSLFECLLCLFVHSFCSSSIRLFSFLVSPCFSVFSPFPFFLFFLLLDCSLRCLHL